MLNGQGLQDQCQSLSQVRNWIGFVNWMYLIPLENSMQCRKAQLAFYKLMQKSSVLSKLETTFTISSTGGIFYSTDVIYRKTMFCVTKVIDFDFNGSIYW